MKAVVCEAPGSLALAERPRPSAPAPGRALVAVSHVGICGTDYHIFEGKHPFLQYPRVMGHEISARVLQAGDGVALAAGTPVIVNPYLACGGCRACRRGKPNCCTSLRVLGVHVDGAFCEVLEVPAANLYPAGALSLEEAATVEFLAIGAHAVRRSGAAAGTRSLVIGAGPIGLGTALFAGIAGQEVTLLDTSAERLGFAASRLGIASVIEPEPDGRVDLAATGNGEGFDVVFDATGSAASIEAAFAHVAHGGALVLVSVVKNEIRFSDPEFHKREMSLIGSRNALRGDFEHVVASIAAGLVPVEALVTHRTTLEGLPRDLAAWTHEKSGLVKAVVAVGG